MGNPISADANERVRLFTSPQSWIEGAALRQLEQLAERNGVESVAGMPDLHPGMNGPVGCAALSPNIVHPDVGTISACPRPWPSSSQALSASSIAAEASSSRSPSF
jgi:release factor H-coupled RctB family protein